jgi:hypothetical protein
MTSSRQTLHSETSHITLNVHDDDIKSYTPSIASRSSITTSHSGSTTTEIGQEQIDHIRDAFAVFDKEMTGSITTEQFRLFINDLNRIKFDEFLFLVKFLKVLVIMFPKMN